MQSHNKMERIALASSLLMLLLASRVRGEGQTPLSTPQSHFQPVIGPPASFGTPAPFGPFGFPGTIRPSNIANIPPIPANAFFGALANGNGIPANGHSFLPVFGRPPQQLPPSNIFPSSPAFTGVPLNGQSFKSFPGNVFPASTALLDQTQINAGTLPEVFTSPDGGRPEVFPSDGGRPEVFPSDGGRPEVFTSPDVDRPLTSSLLPVFPQANAEEDGNHNNDHITHDLGIPARDVAVNTEIPQPPKTQEATRVQEEIFPQKEAEMPTSALPEAFLTTALPLPSPPTTPPRTTSEPPTLTVTEPTPRPAVSLDFQTTSAPVESASVVVDSGNIEVEDEITDISNPSKSENNGRLLASHIEKLKLQLSQSNNEEEVSQTNEEVPITFTPSRDEVISKETNQDSVVNNKDASIQPVPTIGVPPLQVTVESRTIENESLLILPDTLNTAEKSTTNVENQSKMLMSDNDHSSKTVFTSEDDPQPEVIVQTSGIKENAINGVSSPSEDQPVNQFNDYDYAYDENENKGIVKAIPETTTRAPTTTSTESPTTKATTKSPSRQNKPLRSRERAILSSRAQLLERLKKLRERRLSTARPRRPVSSSEKRFKQGNSTSTERTSVNRRLNLRRPGQRRTDDEFYSRLRNRIATTRSPKRNTTSSSLQKTKPVAIFHRPTTKKPLSFRERLERYRENNRFVPLGRRRTTPRTTTPSPVTKTSTITEEVNTEDVENDFQTRQPVVSTPFTTEATPSSKMQAIRDKIAAMLSSSGLSETTTTEHVLSLLEDVTEAPLFADLFNFSTTESSVPSTSSTTLNPLVTIKTTEEEGGTRDIPLDDLLSTIVNTIQTTEVPMVSFFGSSFITGPTTLSSPEAVSYSVTSTHFGTSPKSHPVTISPESNTDSSDDGASFTIIDDSLRSGNTLLPRRPLSTTEIIYAVEHVTSDVPVTADENAMSAKFVKQSTESAVAKFTQSSEQEEKIDDSSIQDFIASLIARGIITEAKPEESLPSPSTTLDSVTEPSLFKTTATQSTLLSDVTDELTESTTLQSETPDYSEDTSGLETTPKTDDGASMTSTPLVDDEDSVFMTFMPFLPRTTTDSTSLPNDRTEKLTPIKIFPVTEGFVPSDPLVSRVRMMDTTEKFEKESVEHQTKVPFTTESPFIVPEDVETTFAQHPFEIPSVLHTAEFPESQGLEVTNKSEVANSDSMDNLNILLRSFGSSSSRPELAAVNRVLGLSLFDPPTNNDVTADVNLEAPELSNDYYYNDYDLEPAATEQVIFTTTLDTSPFETQTLNNQRRSTESSVGVQNITISENLIPTALNMDVTSFTVSEPSVMTQNLTKEMSPNGTTADGSAEEVKINTNNFEAVESPEITTIESLIVNVTDIIPEESLSSDLLADSASVTNEDGQDTKTITPNIETTTLDPLAPIVSDAIPQEAASSDAILTNRSSALTLQENVGDTIEVQPFTEITTVEPLVVSDSNIIPKRSSSSDIILGVEPSLPTASEEGNTEILQLATETTTIEPLVISASDIIPQQTHTIDGIFDNGSSPALHGDAGQSEEKMQGTGIIQEAHIQDRLQSGFPDESISFQGGFHDELVGEENRTNDSLERSDAHPKPTVRERPDLLLLLKDRNGNRRRQNDSSVSPPRRGNSIPFSRVRNTPKNTPSQAPRGRVSLSQLLSQRTVPGSPTQQPHEKVVTDPNSVIRFLSDTNSQTPQVPQVPNISGGSSFSFTEPVSEQNTRPFVSSSVEREPEQAQLQVSTDTPEVSDADKKKELAFLKFLALNSQMLKNLKKTINTSSASSDTTVTTPRRIIDNSDTSTSSSFHRESQQNTKQSQETEIQNQRTTFLRPVPQPRFFNVSSLQSSLSSTKPASSGNQPFSHSRKDPPQFLVPSRKSDGNSTRFNAPFPNRSLHSAPPSRFLIAQKTKSDTSSDSNFKLPVLSHPIKQHPGTVIKNNGATTKSPNSFLIPFTTEPSMSPTTNAPIMVLQQTTENNQVRDQSSNNRPSRFSTPVPTSPRPSIGRFTTLASLLGSNSQSTSRPSITTTPRPETSSQAFQGFTSNSQSTLRPSIITTLKPETSSQAFIGFMSNSQSTSRPSITTSKPGVSSQAIRGFTSNNQNPSKPSITTKPRPDVSQAFRKFTRHFGEQKLVTITPATIQPDFEESTTQLGPMDIEPVTFQEFEFESTISPEVNEESTTISEIDETTKSFIDNTLNFESGRTVPSLREETTTSSSTLATNFKPSKFLNRHSTTVRPKNRFDANNSIKRQGTVESTSGPLLHSHNQNIRGTTTVRNRITHHPTTSSPLSNSAFTTSATTFSPSSFQGISTTGIEPEIVTIVPTTFNFDSSTVIPLSLLGQDLQNPANQITTGTTLPATSPSTISSFINQDDPFFSEDEPPSTTMQDEELETTTVTESNPINRLPAFTVAPKVILLALPVVNATTLEGLTNVAPKEVNSNRHEHSNRRVTPSQLLRNQNAPQTETHSVLSNNQQDTNLRNKFLSSLPSGARPRERTTTVRPNFFQNTPTEFPRLQQSISQGVSIRAEEGIIQRIPERPQNGFAAAVNQQGFAPGGFATTTPSPLPTTSQILNSASVDNDPDNDHIPGEGGVDYPILDFVPQTSFQCTKSLSKGGKMYADPETACQVYHLCNGHQKFSFLCPRGTIFHQETAVCQWWYTVDCLAQARKLAQLQALGES